MIKDKVTDPEGRPLDQLTNGQYGKSLIAYPRSSQDHQTVAPLGLLQWLRLFIGTLYAWHLTYTICLVGASLLNDLSKGSQNMIANLQRMLFFLIAGPFTYAEYLPTLAIIFLASVAAARMKPSWLPLVSVAMGAGAGMTIIARNIARDLPANMALVNLIAVVVAALVGCAALFFLTQRLRRSPLRVRRQSGSSPLGWKSSAPLTAAVETMTPDNDSSHVKEERTHAS